MEDFQETFRMLTLDQKHLVTEKLMATIELEKNQSIKCKLCESCGELGYENNNLPHNMELLIFKNYYRWNSNG